MSYPVEGYCTVYNKRVRRARKSHRCSACHLSIQPGERYMAVFWAYDGIGWSLKRCGRCETVYVHLQQLGGPDWAPDEELACGQNYEAEWDQPPPDHLQALIFATSDEASQLLPAPGRVR